MVTASTGNTNGYFYVRVQGHDDQVFDAAPRLHADGHRVRLRTAATLDPKTGETLMPPIAGDAPSDPTTVIVTDRLKTNYALDEERERDRVA